jgi:replicative DNA helicase
MIFDAQHAITRIVQTGSILKYNHLLKLECFDPYYSQIIEALQQYERQYGVCMDEPTFKTQFPDFKWAPSEVQVEFFLDEINQQYIETEVLRAIESAQASLKDDRTLSPRTIAKMTEESLHEISVKFGISNSQVRLLKDQLRRLEYFRSRKQIKGLTGVTLGLDLFDEITNGTQPGEIELWVARPGNCKTFALLWSALCAYQQGKRVTFVSPEMSELEIGLRLDTFMFHRSQSALMSGRVTSADFDAYSEGAAVNKLISDGNGEFFFHEASLLGRRFDVDDIAKMIESDQPDIVVIDGLLLISPVSGKFKDRRTELALTTEELKSLAISTKVPLRIAHQANRDSDANTTGKRKKETTAADFIPDLHNLSESGATEQFANRVICMKYDAELNIIYYAMRKNRNGRAGKIITTSVDIDRGIVGKPRPYEADDGRDKQVELPADSF